MRYERLKHLGRHLPAGLRDPLRRRWRSVLGDPEHHVATALSDPTKISVDIGAGTGGFAEVLSRASTRCEAFEANPANWPHLRANVAGFDVHVNECALSDQDGEVILRVPVVGEGEALPLATIESHNALNGVDVHMVDIPCRRLDGLDLEPVGFMKIDVEGHEEAVLRGSAAILERDKPNLLIEIEERHRAGAVQDVIGYLTDFGYHTYFLLGRHLKPISAFDPSVHQDPNSIEFTDVRPGHVYVNNFVFVTRVDALDGLTDRRL